MSQTVTQTGGDPTSYESLERMIDLRLPLVSIIVPTHNYGEYVSDAINSALNQTYKNIELLVIDDGSTDDTRAIVARFEGQLSYYFQENGGVSSARNFGVRQAKGEFVVFLDSDDMLHEDYVEETLTLLQQQSQTVGFVYTQLQNFEANSDVSDFAAYSLHELKINNYIPSGSLIRGHLARRFHYNERFSMLEDWDYYLTLAENGFVGLLLNKPLIHYRQHLDSRSALDRVSQEDKLRSRHAIIMSHKKLYGIRRILIHETWYLSHEVRVLSRGLRGLKD